MGTDVIWEKHCSQTEVRLCSPQEKKNSIPISNQMSSRSIFEERNFKKWKISEVEEFYESSKRWKNVIKERNYVPQVIPNWKSQIANEVFFKTYLHKSFPTVFCWDLPCSWKFVALGDSTKGWNVCFACESPGLTPQLHMPQALPEVTLNTKLDVTSSITGCRS